ncbi:MAG: radical SAM protein [Chitinophagales bacterium]|nr:radical SAM protein [Chitinophagales bacterium]
MYLRDNYSSPESKASYYWQPIDLLVQSGFLKNDFNVEVLDAIVEKKTNNDVLQLLAAKPYYSVLSLTGSASWPEDFELFEQIKQQHPQIILALTGNLPLFRYNEIFATHSFLDVVLLDYTTNDYQNYLLGKTELLQKIVYRTPDNKITVVDKKLPREFSFSVPQHKKFNHRLYRLPFAVRQPATVAIGSAGCPHKCDFCVASEINYRFRNTDNLIEELKAITAMGFKEVGFTEFMFEVNRHRALEICNRIIAEKIDITWSCNCRVDTLDEELLTRMKQAGCHTIQFGIESGDQAVLDMHSKRYKVTTARETIALCNKVGIRTFGNFILGLPGDTENNMRNVGKYARSLGCTNAVFSTLVPDFGTSLRDKVVQEGKMEDKLTTFSSTDKVFEKPLNGVTPDKLLAIRRKVMIDFYLHPKFIYDNFIKVKSFYELKAKVAFGLKMLTRI